MLILCVGREKEIPAGPGRGSGAGCLVAYLLGITDIDPLRFGLLLKGSKSERVYRQTSISIFVVPEVDVKLSVENMDGIV